MIFLRQKINVCEKKNEKFTEYQEINSKNFRNLCLGRVIHVRWVVYSKITLLKMSYLSKILKEFLGDRILLVEILIML